MALSFGQKTAAMRAIRNMSQIALTHTSGVNYRHISMSENGRRELTADEQGRVRIALDFPQELDAHFDAIASGGFVK